MVSANPQARACKDAIARATQQRVQVAETASQARAALGRGEFSLVIFDESSQEPSGRAAEALLAKLDLAAPLYLNLALCGAERLVNEVRAALRRRAQERLAAIRSAEAMLRNELTAAVTGILLSSELALRVPSLPAAAAEKMHSVHDLAMQMRSRLRI